MDIETARKITQESQQCTGRVKEIRNETVKKKADFEISLKTLEGEFCQALVSYRLQEITKGELKEMRSQISEIELELKEMPALLKGFNLRQKAELDRIYNPIAVIRDANERKQQEEEFLLLQEQVLERAASTRERGGNAFKRLVEKYKELSRRMGREDACGVFLRRQSL